MQIGVTISHNANMESYFIVFVAY